MPLYIIVFVRHVYSMQISGVLINFEKKLVRSVFCLSVLDSTVVAETVDVIIDRRFWEK